MTYTVEVTETRKVRCIYTVDARDRKQAIELAESGETEDESEVELSAEVVDRDVDERTLKQVKDET